MVASEMAIVIVTDLSYAEANGTVTALPAEEATGTVTAFSYSEGDLLFL